MKINKNDRCKCGIYKIVNMINQKVYVGKAKNIYNRMINHKYQLNKKDKNENRHLINAWHKYGSQNFEYFIIEEEDFWIVELKATDRKFGYNLRRDSSTGLIISEETRKLKSKISMGENNPNYGNKWTDKQKLNMSNYIKQQFASGERTSNPECGRKACIIRNKRWTENPQLKEDMKKKVSSSITEYKKNWFLDTLLPSFFRESLSKPVWEWYNESW